eukprot:scaffold6856_cov124-Isochrysis_galbana.AAC.6
MPQNAPAVHCASGCASSCCDMCRPLGHCAAGAPHAAGWYVGTWRLLAARVGGMPAVLAWQRGLPTKLAACNILKGRRLLPSERHWSFVSVSSPFTSVNRLEKSERLVRLVSVSSPEMAVMLLKDRSSHSRVQAAHFAETVSLAVAVVGNELIARVDASRAQFTLASPAHILVNYCGSLRCRHGSHTATPAESCCGRCRRTNATTRC